MRTGALGKCAGILVSLAVVASLSGAPAGKGEAEQAKASFTAGKQQPLAKRITTLQKLETELARKCDRQADPEKQAGLSRVLYDTQMALAKHDKASETFGRYAAALRKTADKGKARRRLGQHLRYLLDVDQRGRCARLAEKALESWGDDSLSGELRYYKARSLRRMPGRTKEAIPVLEMIIAENLDSPFRPKAMRLLANLQYGGYVKKSESALATLSLMQTQYCGTKYEQYAHMRAAAYYETSEGDPNKALKRYRESLKKFPDHHYASYVRRQIKRLRKVVEKQLIDDALQRIAVEETGCGSPVRSVVTVDAVAPEISMVSDARD